MSILIPPRFGTFFLALSVAVTFSVSRLSAKPIDISLSDEVAAAVAIGEGDGTLSAKDHQFVIDGAAKQPGKYVENWNLEATVFDYILPNPVALPQDCNRVGLSCRRLNSLNKGNLVGLRLIVSDARGGRWAVGTRFAAMRSRVEASQNFQRVESFAFYTSEAGRIDPWVMTSLDPKEHDEYDGPKPPLKLAGFRVVAEQPKGESFHIEVRDIEPLTAGQYPSPYWSLIPQKLWAWRMGADRPNYAGNWGFGEENRVPNLKAGDLRLLLGNYKISWELLGADEWTCLASGAEKRTISDSADKVVQLPLLAAGTYNLHVNVWKEGEKAAREFYLAYVVLRNTQFKGCEKPKFHKSLEWGGMSGPVVHKGSVAKVQVRSKPGIPISDDMKIAWTVQSADMRILNCGEVSASGPFDFDLSKFSESDESSLVLTARLLSKGLELDVSRRVIGFGSPETSSPLSTPEAPLEDKMEIALKGCFYRAKGDWSEGSTSVATQLSRMLERVNPWLDDAKEIGYNSVELPAPWIDLNPLPGVYQFSYMDKVVAEAKKRGMLVTFRINPCEDMVPPWISRELMEDQNGFAHGLWSGANNLIFSPSAPQFRSGIFKFLHALSTHYKNDTTVVGYTLGSLYADHDLLDSPWLGTYVDYSDAAQHAFRDYLKEQYHSKLQALNQAYGSSYRDWANVPPPTPELVTDSEGRLCPRTKPAWMDWMQFKINSIGSLRLGMADALRQGDPKCRVGMYASDTSSFYYDGIAARKCWVTYGSMESQYPLDSQSGVRGRFEPWAKITNTSTLADVGLSNIFLSAPAGYYGFFNYWMLDKRLSNIAAISLDAERRLAQWFKVVDVLVGSTPIKTDASICKEGAYLAAFSGQLTGMQHVFTGRFEDFLRPFSFRCSADNVRIPRIERKSGVEISLGDRPYIYVPFSTNILDKDDLRLLSDYVHAGGRLVMEATSGFWLGETANALGETFGIPVAKPVGGKGYTPSEKANWEQNSPIQNVPLAFRTQEFKPPINDQLTPWIHCIPRAYLRPYRLDGKLPEGAEVVAKYSDGTPAALIVKKGAGNVLFLCGVVDWLGCPELARAVNNWGLKNQSTSTRFSEPELLRTILKKGSTRFVVGRRFVGQDAIEKLQNGKVESGTDEPKKMPVQIPIEEPASHSYDVRELLSGTDLGLFTAEALAQSGVLVNLHQGQAFILQAEPTK